MKRKVAGRAIRRPNRTERPKRVETEVVEPKGGREGMADPRRRIGNCLFVGGRSRIGRERGRWSRRWGKEVFRIGWVRPRLVGREPEERKLAVGRRKKAGGRRRRRGSHSPWLIGLLLVGEIYHRFRESYKGKDDIHTRLMRRYKDIPSWWFQLLLAVTVALSLTLCIALKKEIQMPWWGLLFACAMAFTFTLPISIITATTNQTPGLNIITEYVMGIILPGRPIANVCFKTYGYMSMAQAVSFLSDFKLGHYMKIPPRSMFLVQFIGTVLAGTINLAVAWWLLHSVTNICQDTLLPDNSPWTCPGDRVFFDASVIWGLVGPKRIFGHLGNYKAMNWFFLGGALGPLVVWLFHKAFPKQTWIPLINLPVLLGATSMMPPATTLNYNSWIIVGTVFNFFIFRYRKQWWQRYNYVLSAALDAGVAFMAVALYFSLGIENRSLNWWGTAGEHCDLAKCPTARGISVHGCPIH